MLPAYKNNFWFVHNNKRIISYRIIWINVMSHTFLLLYSNCRYTKVGSFAVSDVYIKYIKIRKFRICLLIYFFLLLSHIMYIHISARGLSLNVRIRLRRCLYKIRWIKYIYLGFVYGQTQETRFIISKSLYRSL